MRDRFFDAMDPALSKLAELGTELGAVSPHDRDRDVLNRKLFCDHKVMLERMQREVIDVSFELAHRFWGAQNAKSMNDFLIGPRAVPVFLASRPLPPLH